MYFKVVRAGNMTTLRHISIKGGGGEITIGNHSYLRNCSFFFKESGNKVIIGDNVKLNGVHFIMRHGGNNTVIIGNFVTTGGDVTIEASEGCVVEIGDDSMLSHHIVFLSTDVHSIMDSHHNRINPAKNIKIGKHVWIGLNSMILKGSQVLDNSIIAANSVYTIKTPESQNSIYAGNPAKEVKKNINWIRELI